MDVQGITALVTGGGHRIGRALALGLAGAGADLVLHHNRSVVEADRTAAEAREMGVRVVLARADLAANPGALIAAAGDLAPIRVLVNSAAVFTDDTLQDLTQDGWDRTLAVNLRAPVLLTQAFAEALPHDLEGAVLNVTDWRTTRPYPDRFSYTIAKGGLDTFTLAAAESLAPRIRVNAVALGAILPPPGRDAAYLKALAQQIPMERTGTTEAVVQAALALLTNDFITGEIVRVNGGAHLR